MKEWLWCHTASPWIHTARRIPLCVNHTFIFWTHEKTNSYMCDQGCHYAGRCWSGPTSTHKNRPAVKKKLNPTSKKTRRTKQIFIFIFYFFLQKAYRTALKGILWDRRWIAPSIGIFSHTRGFFYRNVFLLMKLSNPPSF